MTIEQVKGIDAINHVAQLARIIWQEHFSSMIGQDIVEYLLDTLQSEPAISEQIRQGYIYYIIKSDRNPVGYFAIQHLKEKNCLLLSKLYLLKSERGRGYGKNAMSFIEAMAHQKCCEKIALTVFHKNSGSIAAYEKMGFQKTGSIKRDVGNNIIIHDLTMEKTLSS